MAIISLKYFFNSKNIYFLFFILGGILGYLNTLKLPESDLINYIEYFNNASRLDYVSYLLIEDKEYIFFTFIYILNKLLFANTPFFLITFTSICYGLILSSIYRLCKFWNINFEGFFLATICALFFPNIFSLSAHLMRQFFAASIICFYVVNIILLKNKYLIIILIITAGLIHTSAFFFLYILLFYGKKYEYSIILKKITFLILFFLTIALFQNVLISLPIIGYGFHRFFNKENAIWETERLNFLQIFIQFFILVCSYFGLKIYYLKFKNIYILFIWILILSVFIFLNYYNTEIAARFTFYIYFIFPFIHIFIYNLIKIDSKKASVINLLMLQFYIFWFVYKLINGVWIYSNLENFFLTLN